MGHGALGIGHWALGMGEAVATTWETHATHCLLKLGNPFSFRDANANGSPLGGIAARVAALTVQRTGSTFRKIQNLKLFDVEILGFFRTYTKPCFTSNQQDMVSLFAPSKISVCN
ncbi:hypothetical protein FDUTEX481_07578 [Tolypothrix sp. PCC 7601]|nr:hypothetical protein FDUTEX481_07578 [Tolypothrix sp. PCC 7601]